MVFSLDFKLSNRKHYRCIVKYYSKDNPVLFGSKFYPSTSTRCIPGAFFYNVCQPNRTESALEPKKTICFPSVCLFKLANKNKIKSGNNLRANVHKQFTYKCFSNDI